MPVENTNYGFVSASANSYTPLTVEAEIIFPKFDHISQSIDTLTTSSLFGTHTSNAIHTETTYYAGGSGKANPGDFDVTAYAIRSVNDSSAVYFRLTSSMMGFDLTSSIFPNSGSTGGSKVYDNSKWNFAFRVRPEAYPFANMVTASQNRSVEFYGVNMAAGQTVHEFAVSKSIDIDKPDGSQEGRGIGHWLTGSFKRFFIGAERTNFTGSVVNKSDVRFLNFAVWADYLTDDEIKSHARDPNNFGRSNPYQNTFVFETGSVAYPPGGLGGEANEYIPRIETLALHWDFENITGSEGTRIVEVKDRSSGSVNLQERYHGTPHTTDVAATATFTVADGDAASGMAEKESVVITSAATSLSTDSTEKTYVVVDDNATTVATGDVLVAGSDTGASTAGAALAGGIAVAINLTGGSLATQNAFLVQLKAAIEHDNGHDGEITVSSVPTEANGNQSITLTQTVHGTAGNTVTTTDISQLTAGDFTGGTDGVGSLGLILKSYHSGTGSFFDSGAEPYTLEFVPTSRQRLPEQIQSSDMIKVLSRDDVAFQEIPSRLIISLRPK